MKVVFLCVVWAFGTQVAAVFVTTAPHSRRLCNTTLPWNVSRESFEDVSDDVFERLMQCPVNLHGCLEKVVTCDPWTTAITCSCAANCRAYRDCCWNVELPDNEADVPESSCVEVQLGRSGSRFVFMVVGCPSTWTDDEVKENCEKAGSFNDTFYSIPVTSDNHITYRNGFCAICNNDTANNTFWTTVSRGAEDVRLVMPDVVSSQPALHLRPCVDDAPEDTCVEYASESVSRKCKTYYAPVTDANIPGYPTYRNVYCAMCGGANVSQLSCRLAVQLVDRRLRHQGHRRPLPNLAALFRPVVSTPTCYAKYDGRCYIRAVQPKLRSSAPRPRQAEETPSSRPSADTVDDLRRYVTVVCISVSAVFLTLKVAVFCAHKEARSFSLKCTLCLSLTLLVSQLAYLFTYCYGTGNSWRPTGAVLFHYGLLSAVCWASVLSYDIWRNLTDLKVSSVQDKSLAIYGIVAWSLPLLVVAAALIVQHVAPGSALSPGYGADTSCFMSTALGVAVYCLLPLATLLTFCFVLYVKTVLYIQSTSAAAGSTIDVRVSGQKDGVWRQQRDHMGLFVRLAVIMGAAWILFFLSFFVHVTTLFVKPLMGLQGVYLFLAFKDYRYIFSWMTKRAKSTPLNSVRESTKSHIGA
ncbi:uncharacterized protein LOC144167552 [Haemaphysalis longicornis]